MERNIRVMGIINITEDSYFSASRAKDEKTIAERAARLLEEGADILDLGACSTRPGSEPVPEETEWKNISLALRTLQKTGLAGRCRISIDTFRSSVVERAFGITGSFIVNDISAGEDDPEMLGTVGRLGLQYIAMHKRGTPADMQSRCDYDNVTSEVLGYFSRFSEKAAMHGIKDYIVDPGFGFAKTVEQNYELMGRLSEFRKTGHEILVGISRKSMITKYLGISTEEALSATSALHMFALENGADILRVHDVREAVQTVRPHQMLHR